MNITNKIIITDTNIITDLNTADVLTEFIKLDNVFMSDLVMNLEINNKTGNINDIKSFKLLPSTSKQLLEINELSTKERKLSTCDLVGFVLARDWNGILATGDSRLRNYATINNVEVIRTLKIIELLAKENIISKEKALKGYNLLLKSERTRIPKEDIIKQIKILQESLIS